MRKAKSLALVALVALLSACGGVARESGGAPGSSNAGSSSAGSSSGTDGAPVANGGQTAVAGSPSGVATAGTTSSALPDAGSSLVYDAGSVSPPSTHPAVPCVSPTPRPHGGGYTACDDGSLRRPSAAACDEALPRLSPDVPIVFAECTSDTDCKASAHGFCAYGACKYGCVTDAECSSDEACFCGDFVGKCIPARCRTDTDCPAGFPCTAFQAPGFSTPDALACQSPEDECLTDAQCGSLNPRVSCKVQVDHRVCYLDPIG